MENYYEVKDVTQSLEIKNAYEEAIKTNAPKYRAVSKTNQYYGWNEKTNKHIKAERGQEWFDNPYYVAPVEEPVEEPIEEPIDEIEADKTEAESIIDYKALYHEKCAEVEKLMVDFEQVRQIVITYKKENEELKDGLSAFKNLLNKI